MLENVLNALWYALTDRKSNLYLILHSSMKLIWCVIAGSSILHTLWGRTLSFIKMNPYSSSTSIPYLCIVNFTSVPLDIQCPLIDHKFRTRSTRSSHLTPLPVMFSNVCLTLTSTLVHTYSVQSS